MQQRHFCLLSGGYHKVWQSACRYLQAIDQVLWVTTRQDLTLPANALAIPANKTKTILGQAFFRVVFDARSGLDVNALAAVTGTIRAGGALILLTPPLSEWPYYPDPDYKRFLPYPYQPEQVCSYFLQRLVRLIRAAHTTPIAQLPAIAPPVQVQTTAGQLAALQMIRQTQQPVVMTADRGRGKSAVLGMTAQQSLRDGLQVILTAPSKAVAGIVFKHAGQPVDFYAPDELLQARPPADILLIDEAAAIPVPMLLTMVQAYPRCVLATTVQGYEGSGRGFVLRFQKALDERVAGWVKVQLQQPVRWMQGDALEAWINRVLMLDGGNAAALACFKGAEALLTRAAYQVIPQCRLVNNEALLRQIFNLLIQAHYQTRPADLRQMLDAPNISIHILEQQGNILAVALLSREGGLDAALTAAIHAGTRRPHGHLLAQSLTFHAGIKGAACLHGERVMRIAVHPDCQGQGLGQQLLTHLKTYAQQQQADYLGVSYALTSGLQAFWERAGFRSARLGFRKDTASGARSLMQILGLTAAGQQLEQQAYQRFIRENPDF